MFEDKDVDVSESSNSAKPAREQSQLESAIRELHQVTEDMQQSAQTLCAKLEPVLLVLPPTDPSKPTLDLPETCAIGREIRHAIQRVRQTNDELCAVSQNLGI